MSGRAITERQYQRLRILGSGNAGLSWCKRDAEPFLRRGWVTADWRPPYYQLVRITPDGLRALAEGVERYGLPDLGPRPVAERRVCEQQQRGGAMTEASPFIPLGDAAARALGDAGLIDRADWCQVRDVIAEAASVVLSPGEPSMPDRSEASRG